jgi:hypothetical protein
LLIGFDFVNLGELIIENVLQEEHISIRKPDSGLLNINVIHRKVGVLVWLGLGIAETILADVEKGEWRDNTSFVDLVELF